MNEQLRYIDEIFYYLNISPEKRLECLQHLLYSQSAEISEETKEKIYRRVLTGKASEFFHQKITEKNQK